jgi:hypothetical protein
MRRVKKAIQRGLMTTFTALQHIAIYDATPV